MSIKLIKNKRLFSCSRLPRRSASGVGVFVFLCFIVFLCFCVLAPGVMAADDYENYGLDQTLGVKNKAGALKDVLKSGDISTIIGSIIGALLAFIGVIFFVLIIYGGFMWMTAQGNEEQVNKAIEIMKQAVYGFIVVAAAYLLTKFVGETIINAF